MGDPVAGKVRGIFLGDLIVVTQHLLVAPALGCLKQPLSFVAVLFNTDVRVRS